MVSIATAAALSTGWIAIDSSTNQREGNAANLILYSQLQGTFIGLMALCCLNSGTMNKFENESLPAWVLLIQVCDRIITKSNVSLGEVAGE